MLSLAETRPEGKYPVFSADYIFSPEAVRGGWVGCRHSLSKARPTSTIAGSGNKLSMLYYKPTIYYLWLMPSLSWGTASKKSEGEFG